ncbi:hypothetical protein HC031_12530 [Planosporangium thailandense]|uniref:Uncharacterized protein n=1 Tax=Planosporangium thailandense TaxID=765197 RepID=A0ABX0XWW8_9ACTN|nr:hypothetical protein [Planosporangium thailandense]NJC70532.1 hypothetical protein [Planosporangium thailandense]
MPFDESLDDGLDDGLDRNEDPPRAVRSASRLLVACAAVAAIDAGQAILAVRHLNAAGDVLSRLAPQNDGPGVVPNIRWSLLYDTTVAAALALMLAPLGYLVRRPSQPARIVTWCVGAVGAMALLVGIAGNPDDLGQPTGGEPAEVQRAMRNLLAGWYPSTHALAVVAEIVGIIAVAVLLARSSVVDFYHLRSQGAKPGLWWEARRWRPADR